jgi:hypothetical protein
MNLNNSDMFTQLKERCYNANRTKDLEVIHNEIVCYFYNVPGITITLYNKGGNIFSAISGLNDIKRRIFIADPDVRVIINRDLEFIAETAQNKYSRIKVEKRFVRPCAESPYIIGEMYQKIDQRTFNKMIDAHEINLL